MKRKIRNLVIVFALVCILTSQAFAITFYYRASSGYDLIWSDDYVYAQIFDLLFTQEFTSICNVSPYASSYTYKVVVSYDELASLVTTANTHQLNTSLYRNDAAGYWVAKVHDFDGNPWFTNDNTPRVLGNPNGYVYVAEIDTSGEDMVTLLDSILVRLTLVESYVKSAYFELWEQGGVLDDIYTLFSRVGALLEDIKSRLYYNGKSAAYYLYMIESHLSDIDSGTGSSGSSSPTDLTGVLEWLETATRLLGLISTRADALYSGLGVSNGYLYQVSTKLDGVSTMVTDLARVKTYLSSIDSDVEDVLSELETATGLIGLMQVDVDALVTAQGVSHDLLAELSSKLTTMIEKQETAFDYLSDLSGDLGTVISNQSAVLSLQQSANLSLSWIESDLADLSGDLGTVISNQNAVLPVMQEVSSKLSSIYDALLYNDKEAAQYLYMINYNMHSQLDSVIGNQEAILALLQQDGAFTTDLSGVLSDLGTVISNQASALPVLQEIAEYLSYLKSNHYSYSIYQELGSVESALSNLLALLQQEGIFTTDISGILANQQEVSTMLSNIENSLVYRESEVGRTLYLLNVNFLERAEILISNQEAILALLQADGAFTTNLSGVLANQQEVNTALTNITKALTTNGLGVAGYLSVINSNLLAVTDIVRSVNGNLQIVSNAVSNISDTQNSVLALLQEEGAFTTDLSGVLADLGTVISNQASALPVLQSVSDSLSTISSRLYYVDASVSYYVYNISYQLRDKLPILISNQEAILALLQQDGVFTTDLSGVLADLGTVIENQGTALPVLQEVSSKLSSIYDALLYNDREAAEYLYMINYNMYTRFDSVIGNQKIGLENQQKLIDLIEDLELTTNVTIENIENITIDVTNKAYEVFYITDSEGNKQNISDFSGDVLSVGGRLLNFFFKVAFDDALDSVDAALDDMTEFYIDDSVLVGGGSLWE